MSFNYSLLAIFCFCSSTLCSYVINANVKKQANHNCTTPDNLSGTVTTPFENDQFRKNNRTSKTYNPKSFLVIPGPKGNDAALGEFPWMVAIGYRNPSHPGPMFLCGGSLISDRWIITAAHCFIGIGNNKVTTVRIGDLNINNNVHDGASPIDIKLNEMKIITHSEYSSSPPRNDIALIRLNKPLKFSNHIRPIRILSGDEEKKDEFYTNKSATIIGWGRTEWGGLFPEKLQVAEVKIHDREICFKNYASLDVKYGSSIDNRVLCANEKETDTCQGDSGGPLMIKIDSTSNYYLAGIVSYGHRCALEKYPGIYTKVAYFYDWIRKVTGMEFKY